MRISSGPASRCAQSQGNPERRDEIGPKAARREARTSGMKMAIHGARESLAHPLVPLPDKKWKVRQPRRCDKRYPESLSEWHLLPIYWRQASKRWRLQKL